MVFNRIVAACVFSGALLSSAGASAEQSGWYVSGSVGAANQSDRDFTISSNTRGELALGSGFAAGGALGYTFNERFRLEGEFIYQSVSAKVSTPSTLTRGDSGDYASTSAAINALVDVDLFGSPVARSYIGVGLVRLTEVDLDVGSIQNFSGSGNGWQLLSGVRYALSERSFLDVGVRYLNANKLDLDEEAGTRTLRADYAPWAVTIGFGWRF
jgi:opacity protein-like surface antigen